MKQAIHIWTNQITDTRRNDVAMVINNEHKQGGSVAGFIGSDEIT